LGREFLFLTAKSGQFDPVGQSHVNENKATEVAATGAYALAKPASAG